MAATHGKRQNSARIDKRIEERLERGMNGRTDERIQLNNEIQSTDLQQYRPADDRLQMIVGCMNDSMGDTDEKTEGRTCELTDG